ncbi:NUDIX hydrolase [Serratia proteamaculans]|uniref:NUDIX hydrolase n=1 Tax=Serratia proteamaculans TaxID=28151 RepID=A0A5Q2VIR6_SERPR|nr:NUDIX hydrolase [Serratia proteamaculans]QGH63930.1 NUDIX hydrolase [Serratia proteamaculans]
MKAQLILIAGPYRSGTDGDPQRIAANLQRLEQAALEVYQRGHVPVIGEWLALPLAAAAGSTQHGDAICEEYLYPVAHRLIAQCQAIYRIDGDSAGADKDVLLANQWGLRVYRSMEEIPQARVISD